MKNIFILLFICIYYSSYSQTENDSILNLRKLDSFKINNDSLKEVIQQQTKSENSPSILSVNKDSLLQKHINQKINTTTFLNKQLKNFQPHGNISLGYEYGVLPFVTGNNYPSGGFKTEGKVSFLLLNLPLELNYYYTSIKNVIGLNNYFRLSYDASRYKEQLSQRLNVKEQLSIKRLGNLQLEQQQLAQKIEYLKFLQQFPDYKSPLDSLKTTKNIKADYFKSASERLQDSIASVRSLKDQNSMNFADTLKKSSLPNVFGLSEKILSDSLVRITDYLRKKDSITSELNNYKAKYDSITSEANKIKKELDQIKNLKDNPKQLTNPYLSKTEAFLSHIKKFEIGLCSPNYSTFLINNTPLQGINVEYSKLNTFFAFTYGTTINTLLFNPSTLQGAVQGTRNLFNYFDFGNLSAGRKIISFKGGVGEKEGSHLYAGILAGRGRTDYLLLADSKQASKESNVVIEVDAKYKFSENFSVEAVLGKSSVKDEDLTMEQVKRAVNEIFSNYRSYAALAKVNLGIKKTNTRLTFSARWIDPYFKSFGLSFLRSDNLRYEIKAEQPITRKIKYTVSYRRGEDNLLNLFDYKNILHSINNSLNIKLTKEFNIRLNYAPLLRVLQNKDTIITDRNSISTVILSYIPKKFKGNAQFNALYSKYLVSGDSLNINFENFTYTHDIKFKSGFKTGLNVSWFKNSLKDTLNNDTYLAVADIGYSTKNNSTFTIGGKMAFKESTNTQYGFLIKASVHLYKGLFWQAEIEKIVIGDYYNGFVIDKIKQFPYYCSTKLTFNF